MLRYVVILGIALALVLIFNQFAHKLVSSRPVYQGGEQVGDFTTRDIDGEEVRFSDYQGKIIFINFFAEWCIPCHTEAPFLEKELWQKYRTHGFQVIGIYADEDSEGARSFRDAHKLTYPMWVKPQGEARNRLNPSFLPWNVLIDRRGVVVYSSPGFDPDEIKTEVKKLLTQ